VGDIEIRRLESGCHITRLEEVRVTKKGFLMGNSQHKIIRKTKNKMGGRPEGCIIDPRGRARDREEWRNLLRETRGCSIVHGCMRGWMDGWVDGY
jgi:hypothetical protein